MKYFALTLFLFAGCVHPYPYHGGNHYPGFHHYPNFHHSNRHHPSHYHEYIVPIEVK